MNWKPKLPKLRRKLTLPGNLFTRWQEKKIDGESELKKLANRKKGLSETFPYHAPLSLTAEPLTQSTETN